jgi:hypothetical protein
MMATSSVDVDPATITIMALGAEGGGVSLFGRQLRDGEWLFIASHVDQTPTFLAGDEESVEIRDRSGWVSGWNDALDMLDKRYRYWPHLYPITVHPDFRNLVLDAVGIRCGAQEVETWADRIDRKGRMAQRRNRVS